ncbi:MAG TPA: type II toxin-antitoxin system PemK/MazF family toxin [Candidatus Paceibacterota bacterium]
MGICRNEIYMVEFQKSYKYCISGLHPCIIVSSFRHLLKNDLIQVLPITSNVKKVCKSHIAIEGFGLHNSKIECEQVLTVNRSDLKHKIGKVDNVKMFEINTILKQHLQLDNKFKNLQSEDLEELFLKGAKKMDTKRELSILKSKIRTTYLEEKFDECITLTDKLINKSKINEFLWFANYSKSLCYMQKENVEQSLECSKESIKYINEVDIFSQDYCLSMFNLAYSYKTIDKEKSINIFKTLSGIYRELTDNKLRISCLFNIAVLQKSVLNMKRLIKIVENTSGKRWYFYEDKEYFLKNLKLELNDMIGS